jgi:glycerophosphoryl diester phosphodiesterase
MRSPWVIAHRGASGHAPENTLAAFQRAVELGATFIETDLQVTRDGCFVAMHDDTVDRTTNGSGEVAEFTLDELRQVDAGLWFDREFMGQRIPTLAEILQFSSKNDVVFYLELKYPALTGMDHSLVAALHKEQSSARTIVISFDPATLVPLRRIDRSVMVGLLVEHRCEDCIQAALDVGARQLCPKFSCVTPALVEQAHRADLQVVTWTVNSAETMRSMISAGVDGIMTDFPDRLRAVIEDSQTTKLAE